MDTVGEHCILELYACDCAKLDDEDFVRAALSNAALDLFNCVVSAAKRQPSAMDGLPVPALGLGGPVGIPLVNRLSMGSVRCLISGFTPSSLALSSPPNTGVCLNPRPIEPL